MQITAGYVISIFVGLVLGAAVGFLAGGLMAAGKIQDLERRFSMLETAFDKQAEFSRTMRSALEQIAQAENPRNIEIAARALTLD
jgi:hypothetical protein